MPSKVYRKVLNKKMKEVIERNVSAEQRRFKKGRECEDQIFAVKTIVEHYLKEDGKLYTVFYGPQYCL